MPWDALLDGPFVFQAFVGGTALALIDFVITVQHFRSDER